MYVSPTIGNRIKQILILTTLLFWLDHKDSVIMLLHVTHRSSESSSLQTYLFKIKRLILSYRATSDLKDANVFVYRKNEKTWWLRTAVLTSSLPELGTSATRHRKIKHLITLDMWVWKCCLLHFYNDSIKKKTLF